MLCHADNLPNFVGLSNRVVRKLQFLNNFLIKSIFAELKLVLARKNAGLVRQLTKLSNKSNTRNISYEDHKRRKNRKDERRGFCLLSFRKASCKYFKQQAFSPL
jgi:hypothetical protein